MVKKISFITEKMLVGHGVELVVDKLAAGLTAKGYDCNVFCTQIDEEYKKRAAYEIIRIPKISETNIIKLEKKIKDLRGFFNKQDTDLFIINTFPYYALNGVLKKPVFSINYGIVSSEGMVLKRRLFFKYMDFTQNNFYFKSSTRIISISKFLNDKIPKNLQYKSTYIYLGADHYSNDLNNKDTASQQALELRKRLGIENEEILMLYVGRLNPVNQPYKGTRELISNYKKAKEKNNALRLLMVGYGSKNDEIALKNEGISVIANAPFDIMPSIYLASDIYTTCTKWEGFDLPIVEAQSFAKPSICYNIGAHPEIMKDNETGYLVNTDKDFVAKLIYLSKNPGLIKKMGVNALKASERFTWEKTVSSYDKLIRSFDAGKSEKKVSAFEKPETSDILKDVADSKKPLITVLIINYNSSAECLIECLDSLKNQSLENFKVVLFDNGSDNNALPSIKNRYFKNTNTGADGNVTDLKPGNKPARPVFKLFENKSNIGFSAAINKALKNIDTQYVLISSFDVVFDKFALEELLKEAENKDENVIGLAPKIKFYYQRDFIESAGTYLDTSLYDGYQGLGQLDLHQYDVPEEVFGLSFTSAFIETRYFKNSKVGLPDEGFFLFYEDFDFCYRAKMLGYGFRTCPKAIIYHKYAYSFRDETTAFQTIYYYKRLNLLKMLLKNCEKHTIDRLLPIELKIMKANLKDKNMKSVSRKIISDFKKSKNVLLSHRKALQLQRLVNDEGILKYCWGENNFFDVVSNEPVFSIDNLKKTYQRLFVITGSNRYMEYINYLSSIENTKLRFDHKILSAKLHSKLENEPISVHKFIDRL